VVFDRWTLSFEICYINTHYYGIGHELRCILHIYILPLGFLGFSFVFAGLLWQTRGRVFLEGGEDVTTMVKGGNWEPGILTSLNL